MQTITIDAQNFIAGASTSNFIADAGYSPLSKGINHLYARGVLHWQPKPKPVTYTGGTIIAAIANQRNLSHLGFFIADDEKLYTIDTATTTTLRGTDTSGNTFVRGRSDMIFYRSAVYVTSSRDLIKWTVPGTFDYTYWSGTLAQSQFSSSERHPLEVIEDTLYIGDANKIHTLTSTTPVQDAMTFGSNIRITTFCKHPNGRDLIVFCTWDGNEGATKQLDNLAYIVNTVTLEFTKEIVLDDMVASAKTVGGITYVTYGTKLGYFTEDGIIFLRQLDIDYGTSSIVTKAKVGNMAGMYLATDNFNSAILGISDLGAGKVFHYPVQIETADTIDSFFVIGEDQIAYSEDANKLYTIDFTEDEAAVNSKLFYTNKYSLPARAWIRRVEIEHTPFVTGVGLKLYNVDKSNNLTDLGTFSYTTSSTAEFSRWDMNIFTSMAQFAVQAIKTAGSPIGIRKITIYYEIGDEV